jgi:hypothetical protein
MPKIVTCTLTGEPHVGDALLFYWMDDRGGRCASATTVQDGDTTQSILQHMIDKTEFLPSFFTFGIKGNSILCLETVLCTKGHYAVEVRGTGTAVLTLDES